jgi:predicted enzyme related to lactoylglutathione lyase
MANPVVHFEILGKEPKKLQDFYAGVFGWSVDANNEMNYGIVPADEGGIGGGIGPAMGPAGHVTFYISVDDPQAYLDSVEKAGGKTVTPVTVIPEMVTFALFSDPEGNIIGLVKSEMPS